MLTWSGACALRRLTELLASVPGLFLLSVLPPELGWQAPSQQAALSSVRPTPPRAPPVPGSAGVQGLHRCQVSAAGGQGGRQTDQHGVKELRAFRKGLAVRGSWAAGTQFRARLAGLTGDGGRAAAWVLP